LVRFTITFGCLTLSDQESSSPVLQTQEESLRVPACDFSKVPSGQRDGDREKEREGI